MFWSWWGAKWLNVLSLLDHVKNLLKSSHLGWGKYQNLLTYHQYFSRKYLNLLKNNWEFSSKTLSSPQFCFLKKSGNLEDWNRNPVLETQTRKSDQIPVKIIWKKHNHRLSFRTFGKPMETPRKSSENF